MVFCQNVQPLLPTVAGNFPAESKYSNNLKINMKGERVTFIFTKIVQLLQKDFPAGGIIGEVEVQMPWSGITSKLLFFLEECNYR